MLQYTVNRLDSWLNHENNFRFKMIQVYDETISIDTPSDLENANKYFEND